MNVRASWWRGGLAIVAAVYLHDALPHLTTLPRVNVDEPWLIERAYQVMTTGVPSQPMLGLHHAYLLQVGYGYLAAPWLALFGVGIFQARLLSVVLGLGIVLMVAAIGRRTLDATAGLVAALFLASDSNFLGGVRYARTDIPSVFFVTAALAAYVAGRADGRARWFAVSGASLGAAMLCHGNAFWAGAVLLCWYVIDFGWRGFGRRSAMAFVAGLSATFGPYLIVVAMRWHDVQVQIGNFAGDRVPGWRPSFVWQQITLETERYRNWYFGLVTNSVPNPLLVVFQIAIVAGLIVLCVRVWRAPRDAEPDRRGAAKILVLAIGGAVIFAAFINNKAAVYMPHVLIGFSLAAGTAVSTAVRGRVIAGVLFVALFGAAAIGYYEKWYSSALKSELVPFESTAETLRALVPAGPKYIYASPQFWTPFHAEHETAFYSYAAAEPVASGDSTTLAGAGADRPIFLIVDELQWLPELTTSGLSSSAAWQRDWTRFIEQKCVVDGVAYGTAHGTLALYRCGLSERPRNPDRARIIGGAEELAVADPVLEQSATELAAWNRWDDPRRSTGAHPEVALADGALRISGTGWPGIVRTMTVEPGARYLVSAHTRGTRDGDLLYLGMWQKPQVRSLSGASASGIPARLVAEPWFPHDRAFIAAAPAVRIAIYSEAPQTDFTVDALEICRLRPAASPSAGF